MFEAIATEQLTVEALSPAMSVIGKEWSGGPFFLIREGGSVGRLRQEGEGVLQAQKRMTAAAVAFVSPHTLKQEGRPVKAKKRCVVSRRR